MNEINPFDSLTACLRDCMLEDKIRVGGTIGAQLRTLMSSLPIPPNLHSSEDALKTLHARKILRSEENEKPQINVGPAADLFIEYLKTTEQFYEQNNSEPTQSHARNAEEEDKIAKMSPVAKWGTLEKLWNEVKEKQQKSNSGWEIQCRYCPFYSLHGFIAPYPYFFFLFFFFSFSFFDRWYRCSAPLAKLSHFHFYLALGEQDSVYRLLSELSHDKWEGGVNERSSTDPSSLVHLHCNFCGALVGDKILHRGMQN